MFILMSCVVMLGCGYLVDFRLVCLAIWSVHWCFAVFGMRDVCFGLFGFASLCGCICFDCLLGLTVGLLLLDCVATLHY